MIDKNILVLGIGNYLMGDEGVGVHVIKAISEDKLPDHVELLDGGTGGFHLLGQMEGYERIIMVDATMDDSPIGTIKHIIPKFSSDYPPSLSAHDIGLKDLVESLILIDKMPKIDLITVSVKDISQLSIDLSPLVKKQIPAIIKKIKELI